MLILISSDINKNPCPKNSVAQSIDCTTDFFCIIYLNNVNFYKRIILKSDLAVANCFLNFVLENFKLS